MALTPSSMMPLGTEMPAFRLPDPNGKVVDSATLTQRAVVVAFICNHCPYVKHLKTELASVARELQGAGAAFVAINSNDWSRYPTDAPEHMLADIARYDYSFPYLLDEDQSVARAFDAMCTPEFFVFDGARKLAYHGQFDDSRPGSGLPITGDDLEQATLEVLAGRAVSRPQQPSMGCGIKWRM